MTDQPQEAFRFWIVAAMHICISLVAQSLGLLIGAACHVQVRWKSTLTDPIYYCLLHLSNFYLTIKLLYIWCFQNAVFIGPITTIPIFLFAGFFVTLKAVPAYLRWVSWLSYARYSFQSTLTAVYGFDRDNLKCTQAYCHFKHPKKFLEQIDAVEIDVVQQSLCLLGILVVCRILSYYALRLKIMVEKQ